MLQMIDSVSALDVRQLTELHRESICLKGKEEYPDLSENMQMLRAEQVFYDFLTVFFKEYGGRYALWTPEGRYCCALRIEPYADGLLLSGLETAPAVRRKGYAKALLRSLLEYLSCNGCDKLYSHVDKQNIPSLALHKACGFQRVHEYAVYIDGSVYHTSCTFCYER